MWPELQRVRNVRPGFSAGLLPGLAHAALDQYLLRGKAWWTLHTRCGSLFFVCLSGNLGETAQRLVHVGALCGCAMRASVLDVASHSSHCMGTPAPTLPAGRFRIPSACSHDFRMLLTYVYCNFTCTACTRSKPDHEHLIPASRAAPIEYPKPDGKLTFDIPTSLYRSGTCRCTAWQCVQEKKVFYVCYLTKLLRLGSGLVGHALRVVACE